VSAAHLKLAKAEARTRIRAIDNAQLKQILGSYFPIEEEKDNLVAFLRCL
jgi:hypothetical protein